MAPGASIVGDVEIGARCSVWFNAVIRGDVNTIRIGEETNIQDNAVLHVTHQTHPLRIGSRVTIGHGAIVHGATVGDCCLIGMGARVLDGAVLSPYSFVAAGSLVLEGFEVPEGVLIAGLPARVRRALTNEEREKLLQSAKSYVQYAESYLRS
ncbi:MAG: gamma carbonic anhydrase family protein [Ignavibacteriales bacterium]|nr:gamma carbonic anhydrase family protein [Ignavibacteriales bacterium]